MRRTLSVLACGLCLASLASAQYANDFEAVNASTTGVDLNGQALFYNPVPASSVSFGAYPYVGNALGVAANPKGGKQFVAVIGPGGSPLFYGRSQRNVSYCGDKWTFGIDAYCEYTGTATAANYIGSFSIQSSTTDRSVNILFAWQTGQEGKLWDFTLQYEDATGAAKTTVIPDVNFQSLAVKAWYRLELDFEFKTGLITEVRLTDIAKPASFKYAPTGWYLVGTFAAKPMPTGLRMFAGAQYNLMAFDNLSLTLREGGTQAGAKVYGSGTLRPNPAGSMVIKGLPLLGDIVSLGAQNPIATQAAGSIPVFFLALKPLDPGPQIPGLGMKGKGAPGEILIDPTTLLVTFVGPAWDGKNPAYLDLIIPIECGLLGVPFYMQAIMLDPTPQAPAPFGLTEGAALSIGNI